MGAMENAVISDYVAMTAKLSVHSSACAYEHDVRHRWPFGRLKFLYRIIQFNKNPVHNKQQMILFRQHFIFEKNWRVLLNVENMNQCIHWKSKKKLDARAHFMFNTIVVTIIKTLNFRVSNSQIKLIVVFFLWFSCRFLKIWFTARKLHYLTKICTHEVSKISKSAFQTFSKCLISMHSNALLHLQSNINCCSYLTEK